MERGSDLKGGPSEISRIAIHDLPIQFCYFTNSLFKAFESKSRHQKQKFARLQDCGNTPEAISILNHMVDCNHMTTLTLENITAYSQKI